MQVAKTPVSLHYLALSPEPLLLSYTHNEHTNAMVLFPTRKLAANACLKNDNAYAISTKRSLRDSYVSESFLFYRAMVFGLCFLGSLLVHQKA